MSCIVCNGDVCFCVVHVTSCCICSDGAVAIVWLPWTLLFQGIVPSDVHLLPGQLKDVHVAMDEVRNTPPPLPAIPRPIHIPRAKTSSSDPSMFDQSDNRSDDSGSFISHFTQAPPPPRSHSQDVIKVPETMQSGAVDNLRQLRDRQHDLMFKSLDTGGGGGGMTSPSSRAGHAHAGLSRTTSRDSNGYPPQHSHATMPPSNSFSHERSLPSHDHHQQHHVTPEKHRYDPSQAWEVESIGLHRSIPDDRSVDTGFDEDFSAVNGMVGTAL